MGRLETRWLASGKNLSALADLSGQWIDKVHARRPPRGVVLDMDSSVSPTHGEQEMSVWNGHYACTCCHPLFVSNQFGDLERCACDGGRPGSRAAPSAPPLTAVISANRSLARLPPAPIANFWRDLTADWQGKAGLVTTATVHHWAIHTAAPASDRETQFRQTGRQPTKGNQK